MSDKPKRNLIGDWGDVPTSVPASETVEKVTENQIERIAIHPATAGSGRPLSGYRTGKKSKSSTVLMYDANDLYCAERVKELGKYGIRSKSDYINWLIEQDANDNGETYKRAKLIYDLSNHN